MLRLLCNIMDFECPSCGAQVQVKNAASLYVVCPYCSTTSVRRDINLEAIGKVAALKEEGSPFQIGSQGYYQDRPFEIIGRIQVLFDAGYWNEWHLDWGGTSAWLGEANGMYVFTRPVELNANAVPQFNDLQIGVNVELDGDHWYVKDKQQGRVNSGEGELPFEIKSGYDAPVVDLVTIDNSFLTIDFSEEPPIFFKGEYVTFSELKMRNLREVYDFRAPAV